MNMCSRCTLFEVSLKGHCNIPFQVSLPLCRPLTASRMDRGPWVLEYPLPEGFAFWSRDGSDLGRKGIPPNLCSVSSPLLSNTGLLSSQPDGEKRARALVINTPGLNPGCGVSCVNPGQMTTSLHLLLYL